MTGQYQFFPRKALIQFPQSQPSADSLGEVEADDRFRYYVKGDAHTRPVRASEWLGAHLAETVGISAPAPSIIELQDGALVFGSRRISGVADAATTAAFLTSPSVTNQAGATILGLQQLLSKIYAFDMFFFNDDRHLSNYLSVDDNGVRRPPRAPQRARSLSVFRLEVLKLLLDRFGVVSFVCKTQLTSMQSRFQTRN